MQPYYFIQAALIAVVVAMAAHNDPRQVIVTVTAPPTPVGVPSAPTPVPLSAAPVPWEQPSAPAPVPVPNITSGNLSLPPLHPTTASVPAAATPVPAPAPGGSGSAGGGPKCGKGYTYCGYMLAGTGHNFAQVDIDKSYCNGLPELCAGGKHKTSVEQAVFVCMNDQPSNIQLLCACSGTCLNNATTNYIAHCDEPCVNP